MKKNTAQNTQLEFTVKAVGYIRRKDQETFINFLPEYKPALKELETFSHVQILWWFSEFDDENSRKTTCFDKMPFEAPPLGVFSCRSPMRPNPIGLTTAKIIAVDQDKCRVQIADMDAFDETPVLDLKAYMPSCDRVKDPKVPEWMEDWPEWMPEKGLGLEG